MLAASEALTAAERSLGVDVSNAWAFSIMHGDIEDPAEKDVLEQLSRLAGYGGHLLMTYGTNDTTAFVFDPVGGRIAVLAMHAEAVLRGRSWWRTHTRFGGDA